MSILKTPNKILFIDFNGVISYNNFWKELENEAHPLHSYHQPIENFLFKEKPEIIKDWMLGKYTSEEIHEILNNAVGVPYTELFEIFERGCRNIDISTSVLEKVQELRKDYYCILATGNMDSFDRFTLPSNPILKESFDEIDNSYNLGIFKTTNSGQYFLDKVKKLGVQISNCVVIDDSASVCKVFKNLGGTALQCYGVEKVIGSLESLKNVE
jgi:FMN phosphatase YigB (HAD superfamily)